MSKEQAKADETLARAVAASGTPLSVAENQDWQEHYKLIQPLYNLLSHYCLPHYLIDMTEVKEWLF